MESVESRRFRELLEVFFVCGDDATRRSLEQKLWDEFGKEVAVLVTDLSGFTRLTEKYGIVHCLSSAKNIHRIAAAIIENHGGTRVKFEADSCYAFFSDTGAAINAAIAINEAIGKSDFSMDKDSCTKISCGIDFGKVLVVGTEDFYGSAVNRASKLGEDIAVPGEILVTREAMTRLKNIPGGAETCSDVCISGTEMKVFKIRCTQ